MKQLENYDFTGKRVRKNGKVLSKFDLSREISRIRPLDAYAIYPDAYLYDDYKNRLIYLLS